ncbi:hypothetical protein KBD81_04250 [Candidatus Woesebacteria bacterium]|nr:hypothetical protein [Candidatus Woesebacteria bacterium]
MGKVRQRFLGIDEIEEQQKKEQKERAEQKKMEAKAAPKDQDETEPEAEVAAEEKVTKKKKAKKEAVVSTKKHGSKYEKAKASFDATKEFDIAEAVALVKKIAFAKFDESVELHINVDKEGLRGEVSLPHSTGRTVRVAILNDAVLEELEGGTINFDILVAHPSQMSKLAKYARTLGPKGMMPNPKAGTVSTDPEAAAAKFKLGSIRWKSESKAMVVHQMIGKLSAEPIQIEENATAFIASVGPNNITSAYISATMTPSVKLSIQSE